MTIVAVIFFWGGCMIVTYHLNEKQSCEEFSKNLTGNELFAARIGLIFMLLISPFILLTLFIAWLTRQF
ncbi:MAG: hypothetical protein WCH46_09660 [bacterium]